MLNFVADPRILAPLIPPGIEHVDLNVKVEYSWRRGRKWESLKMSASGEPQSIPVGSHAEFITEHHWGYTCVRARHAEAEERRRTACSEYRVEHPRWKIWNADTFKLRAELATL